jgi:hypothetical protein
MVFHHRNDGEEEDEEMTLRHHGCFSHPFLVQSIFLLLGVGALVPWNAFISAKPYFESRLCTDGTIDHTSARQNSNHHNIESTFSMVYNVSSVLTMLLVIAIQMLRDRQGSLEDTQRVVELSGSQVHTAATVKPSRLAETSITSSAFAGDATQSSVTSPQRTETRVVSNAPTANIAGKCNDHSFWLVTAPLLIFLMVFILQCTMVLMVNIPHFYTVTLLCIAACGMASGIAGAGFVAAAGAFPPSLAMNPYQLVCSLTLCQFVMHFEAILMKGPTPFISFILLLFGCCRVCRPLEWRSPWSIS